MTEKIEKLTFRGWLLRQLMKAYLDARKGKRGTSDEHEFELHWARNLIQLANDLVDRAYKPSRGIQFDIYSPVPREIFAAPFRDRIVHHFLFSDTYPWWDKRFIRDSYSCRKGKGTLDGILRLRSAILKVSRNYTRKAYVIKIDIKSYFMSIDRQILYGKIKEGLDRQYADNPGMRDFMAYIWSEIVLDDPVKGVHKRGPQSRKARAKIPPDKLLENQREGVGLVIGNVTSQLASNIYLNRFDWFVKKTLGHKFYGRYVDDCYIVVTAEELTRTLSDIERMRRFLKDNLGLTVHPNKFYCQEVKKGVEFLGAVIYPSGIYPSRRFRRNFYDTAAAVGAGKKDAECLISYVGHGKYMNMKKVNQKAFSRAEWTFMMRYGIAMWASVEKVRAKNPGQTERLTTG